MSAEQRQSSEGGADPFMLQANLTYVLDTQPGIKRIKKGRGFSYHLPCGSVLKDRQELNRIKELGLPPAYTDVWICLKHNGHIQATGYDNAARKQYRYHESWTEFRGLQKFNQLADFGKALPRLRTKVNSILKSSKRDNKFSKLVATAALVRLLDRTAIRVGGRSTTSKGATTLDMKNVKYSGGKLILRYRAKGGKKVQCSLRDSRLQNILETVDDLPGKRLFQYIGQDGEVHPLDSGDVNQWLKDATGMEDVSAKIFRTWHGSVAALDAIYKAPDATIKMACEAAANALRNTPAICRKSYVHPAVLDLVEVEAGERRKLVEKRRAKISGLRASENRLYGIIDYMR